MMRPWLAPLNLLYGAGVAWRNHRIESGAEPVQRLAWPVLSIGNLSTGGAGKTPLTIALARGLAARGFHVDVLSRGYGRRSNQPARVDPHGTAAGFGDEPLEIARATGLPVYVAPQRYQAGLLAESEAGTGAANGEPRRLHLLDDGFQHRQLHRDVDILLLSARDLADRLLPAGNLREPLANLRRATVLAVPADEPEVEQWLRRPLPAAGNRPEKRWPGPIWRLRRRMEAPAVEGPVLAFCGIACPEQFFAGLQALGLELIVRVPFADHYHYRERDLKQLAARAREAGAVALVTTEKDRARLGRLALAGMPLEAAELRTEIEDAPAALDWLVKRLAQQD